MRQMIAGLGLIGLACGLLSACVLVPASAPGPPAPAYDRPGPACRWVWMDGYWAGGRWMDPHWECRRP